MQEYRDAMLQLAITQNMVWSKVESGNQETLMEEWEQALHSSYKVRLNEDLWSTLPLR